MKIIKNNRFLVALAIISILLIQLVVFWPSFKLSLWGDDWLAFWRYSRILDIDPAYGFNQGYNHLTYFLTPYGPQDINMGLLQKLFGYSPSPYYLVSFSLRFILALTAFFVVYKFTSKVLPSFFTGSFLAITTIGLDTTNWVFNMTSYMGLIFAILFAYFYLRSFARLERHKIFIAYIFLFLAIVIVPIRMHGALPLIVATELYWYIINRKKENSFKIFILRLSFLPLLVLIIKSIGTSFADPNESVRRVTNGFGIITELIREGKVEVLIYPLTNFGNMIFPEVYWESLSPVINTSFLGRPRPFPVFSLLIFSIYLFIVSLTVKGKKEYRKLFINFAILGFLGNVLIWFFYKASPITFSSLASFGATLVGVYTASYFLGIIFFNILPKSKVLVFFLTLWPIAFIALPWLTSPFTVFNAAHRYLIASAVGVSLLWLVVYMALEKKGGAVILVFAFYFAMHAYATNMYLDNLVQKRGIAVYNQIWSVLDEGLPEYEKGDEYYVVYFEGDSKNGDVVHHNAFFGFPPKMSLMDDIYDQDDIPVAITTHDDLVAMVTTGGSLKAHAKEETPIPLDRVYAFSIYGSYKENLIVENITREVREGLKVEKLNYQEKLR